MPTTRPLRPLPARFATVLAALASTTVAAAATPGAFHLEPAACDPSILAGIEPLTRDVDAAIEDDAASTPARAPRIGDADTTAFEVVGSAASDFDGVDLGIVDAGVTWYVAEGVGFGVFAEGLYASLGDGAGDGDSWGGGGGALIRWQFVRRETWSMFAEAGCGIVVSSEAIPDQGTTTNFTPRVNVGASFALDAKSELLLRAGWFHLSNAQTGDENDGVDALSIGVGLSFAF